MVLIGQLAPLEERLGSLKMRTPCNCNLEESKCAEIE